MNFILNKNKDEIVQTIHITIRKYRVQDKELVDKTNVENQN